MSGGNQCQHCSSKVNVADFIEIVSSYKLSCLLVTCVQGEKEHGKIVFCGRFGIQLGVLEIESKNTNNHDNPLIQGTNIPMIDHS